MNNIDGKKKHIAGALAAAGMVAMLSVSPCSAFDGATLSKIDINSDLSGNYNITLKTDRKVNFQKHITADNKIVLDIKNTRPADFVNTIYNNASRIDHVIVQPGSGNSVRIFIQGSGVSSSKIGLTTGRDLDGFLTQSTASQTPAVSNFSAQPLTQAVKKEQAPVVENLNPIVQPAQAATIEKQQVSKPEPKQPETLELTKPVDEFKPVESFGDENTEEASLNAVQNSMMPKFSLSSIFSTSILDWVLRFGVLALLLAGAFKLFAPKSKEIKIDLNGGGDLRSRELDLYKSLNNKRDLIGVGLKSSGRPSSPTRNIPGYSSMSQYGMREYQNSNVNPVNRNMARPAVKQEKAFVPQKVQNIPVTQKVDIPKPAVALNRPKVSNTDMAQAKVNIDNIKFLENMAKIYEKSGRTDLAQGIQSSIIRAKRSV